RAGQAPAAAMTQEVISLFRPRLMVMTGFCGGRVDRVEPGDLIAFTTSYAWDYGKWVKGDGDDEPFARFEPRPTPVNVEENGVDRLVRIVAERGDAPSAELERKVRELSGDRIGSWKV